MDRSTWLLIKEGSIGERRPRNLVENAEEDIRRNSQARVDEKHTREIKVLNRSGRGFKTKGECRAEGN